MYEKLLNWLTGDIINIHELKDPQEIKQNITPKIKDLKAKISPETLDRIKAIEKKIGSEVEILTKSNNVKKNASEILVTQLFDRTYKRLKEANYRIGDSEYIICNAANSIRSIRTNLLKIKKDIKQTMAFKNMEDGEIEALTDTFCNSLFTMYKVSKATNIVYIIAPEQTANITFIDDLIKNSNKIRTTDIIVLFLETKDLPKIHISIPLLNKTMDVYMMTKNRHLHFLIPLLNGRIVLKYRLAEAIKAHLGMLKSVYYDCTAYYDGMNKYFRTMHPYVSNGNGFCWGDLYPGNALATLNWMAFYTILSQTWTNYNVHTTGPHFPYKELYYGQRDPEFSGKFCGDISKIRRTFFNFTESGKHEDVLKEHYEEQCSKCLLSENCEIHKTLNKKLKGIK